MGCADSDRSGTAFRPLAVVAIGASAGGMDALEPFFGAVPHESGVAYVVIRHLVPDCPEMMGELLARHTAMPIRTVEHGMVLEADRIYLNVPRSDVTIVEGRFAVSPPAKEGERNSPIDAFFESLAGEFGADAIGVILSGPGADGSRGCAALKSAGGGVFVQDPDTARFDSMPLSVIGLGFADGVAAPGALPGRIADYRRDASRPPEVTPAGWEPADPLAAIFFILRDRFGVDFSHYKRPTIERRIQRRCDLVKAGDLTAYGDLLAVDRDEVAALCGDLLIDVTSFFRDAEAFRRLGEAAIPVLAGKMSANRTLRVWTPGCASGEEPYSLAMMIAEYARLNRIPLNLKILATDLHAHSLDVAGAGIYGEDAVRGLPDEYRERYFDREGGAYRIKAMIRRLVVFSPHNLVTDPPFTRIDLISCRNLLIYFNESAQRKALSLFHFALVRDGYLFLGPSESVGGLGGEFRAIDSRWRIFQKIRDRRPVESGGLSVGVAVADRRQAGATRAGHPASRGRSEAFGAYNDALKTMLARYAPSGFLLSTDGALHHVFGNAGRLMTVDSGAFSRKLVDLLPKHLRLLVSSSLDRAKASGFAGTRRSMSLATEAGMVTFTADVEPLPDPDGQIDFVLLTIEERVETGRPSMAPTEPDGVSPPAEAASYLETRIRDLEDNLRSTEESLQATIEELETSNEELMASNEELQSTNEELHSVNEELYTVTAEHRRKIEELTESTRDMDHLLMATGIGTIFLDGGLNIRRFTPAVRHAFQLTFADVGRPISPMAIRFRADGFFEALEAVNRGAPGLDLEIEANGGYFLLRVLAYAADGEGLTGVVVTVIDVNEIKKTQRQVTQVARDYDRVLTDIPYLIARWRAEDGAITYCNEAFADYLGGSRDDFIGRSFEQLARDHPHLLRIPAAEIRQIKLNETRHFQYAVTLDNGRTLWRDVHYRGIDAQDGSGLQYLASATDATYRVRYADALETLNRLAVTEFTDVDAVVHAVLDVGRTFFDLPQAVFVRDGESGRQVEVVSRDEDVAPLYEIGDGISFRDFPCNGRDARTGGTGGVFRRCANGWSASGDDDAKGPFDGAAVSVDGKPFGALCFLCHARRRRSDPDFDPDRGFMRLLGSWLGLMIDRVNQTQKLKRSEQELKLIFDNVPACIWYKDDRNRILRLNEAAADLLGVPVREAEMRGVDELLPDQAAQLYADDLAVLDSGIRHSTLIERTAADGGGHMWLAIDKIPYVDDTTGKRSLLIVASDVSGLKKRELQLEVVNSELAHANESLKRFAFIAAHDLQEPLRKIQQFSDLLSDEYGDRLSGDAEFYIGVMKDSAERMRCLIRDLLAFSRAANRPLDLRKLNLGLMVAWVIDDLAISIEETRARIAVDGDLPDIVGDETLVRQMILNLVSNAVKYHRPDEAPDVRIAVRRTDAADILSVSDKGPGIAKDDQQRIFDAFTRLRSGEKIEGTGIGLATCRTVCDRHGWSLSVQSDLGAGATFLVEIPRS